MADEGLSLGRLGGLPPSGPRAVSAAGTLLTSPTVETRAASARRSGAAAIALVPAVDAVALLLTAALVGRFDAFGLGYGLSAVLLVNFVAARPASRLNPRLGDDAGWLVTRLASPLLVLWPLAGSSDGVGGSLALGFVAVPLVLVERGLAYALLRRARGRGLLRRRTLVLGVGAVALDVAEILRDHREYGLDPVWLFDPSADPGPRIAPVDDRTSLAALVDELGVQVVVVAFSEAKDRELVDVLRGCEASGVDVFVVPRLFELGVGRTGPLVEDVWGIPLLRLRRPTLTRGAVRVKRAFDVIGSSLALALISPLFATIAIAVRFSSPGPIIFRQQRVGERGRVFEVLKFRSMRVNDDSDTTWSVASDGRVTRVGRFLRRTSLDELPQLINVLKGDMSLVGPRPQRVHFAKVFSEQVPRFDDRHRVRVGITGWAQVHGLRGDTSIPDRIRMDNHYIEHWSLWQDVVILARTVKQLLSGGGA